MSSRSPVELDFFGLAEKENTSSSSSSSKSQFQKLLEQQRTVRGMQSAISKLNPQLLKNVISSGVATNNLEGKSPEKSAFIKQETVLFGPNGGGGVGGGLLNPEQNRFSVPSTPNKQNHHQNFASALPVFNLIPRCSSEISTPPGTPFTAPLTIFYNGTVSVFDVPRDKAEILMKLAENGISSKTVESTDSKLAMCSSSIDEQKLLEKLNGDDLPIARRKSLQRFLEKRKERK
ncbi:Tify [Macleaya cordata]|uniref:Protein TIFY n=1 Tax=Macleaya cordata TaxID=56857 RepID=A0A200R3U4_MACCD|nr:Tify [Macleaya cordata]